MRKNKREKAEAFASAIEKLVLLVAAIAWLMILSSIPAYAKPANTPTTLEKTKAELLTNIAAHAMADRSVQMADQVINAQEQQRLAEEEAAREAEKVALYDKIWNTGSATMTQELADQIYDCVSQISNTEAQDAVLFALSRIGYPYSQDMRNTGDYYDCSSLMYFSYEAAGVDLSFKGATAAAFEAQGLHIAGKDVAAGDVQPGDLIFYSRHENGRYMNITHVSMYIGNGKIVHARDAKHGVLVDDATFIEDDIVAICRPWSE